MIRRILVALDNSDFAGKVMFQALDLAKLYQAQLYAASVINYSALSELDPTSSGPAMADAIYSWTNSFQEVLDRCRQLAKEVGVDSFQVMLNGNPPDEIVKYAEENRIDMIVIGHIGKTLTGGLVLGSVSKKVASQSKCTVVIVK